MLPLNYDEGLLDRSIRIINYRTSDSLRNLYQMRTRNAWMRPGAVPWIKSVTDTRQPATVAVLQRFSGAEFVPDLFFQEGNWGATRVSNLTSVALQVPHMAMVDPTVITVPFRRTGAHIRDPRHLFESIPAIAGAAQHSRRNLGASHKIQNCAEVGYLNAYDVRTACERILKESLPPDRQRRLEIATLKLTRAPLC